MTVNGNSRFSLSGNTITHSSMGTNETTDTVTIKVVNDGDSSKSATASKNIVNIKTGSSTSGGVYTYGSITAGTITNATIPASGGSANDSNFKTCEIGSSESAIFEVVEVLYNTERIKVPVSIRFLDIGNPDIRTHSVWNLKEGANIENVQNDWNNILANWEDSNIYDLVIEFRNNYFVSGGGSLTINSVISEPGQYNVVAFGYDSTSLFTAFELTLTRDTNKHFIVGLLKQIEYIVTNGQFRRMITWFSLVDKNLGNMPYYTGSKTFGDIVSFAKANLNITIPELNS